jgi:hypothetical protein
MKCTPLMPPVAGSVIRMDLAASSERLKASAELTSGLRSPARTAMPKLVRTTGTMVLATILPSLASSSAVAVGRMITS